MVRDLEAAKALSREAEQNAVGVGMAIAAGIVMSCWGAEVQAKEILGAAGLTTVKALREAGVDWYDIRLLAPVLRDFRDTERRDRAISKARNGGSNA